MKTKGNKKMHKPRQKVIHNPIPTSLFLSRPQHTLGRHLEVKMCSFSLPNPFITNKQSFLLAKQRCRDGVMNDFLSWFMHLHDLTSLHPPSFHRNDFSTCKPTVDQVKYQVTQRRHM